MATIGRFTPSPSPDAVLRGFIRTLAIDLPDVAVVRDLSGTNERSPNYRIWAGEVEVGVAWDKDSEHGDFITVTLDCPTLPAQVYASLYPVDREDKSKGYRMDWRRVSARR